MSSGRQGLRRPLDRAGWCPTLGVGAGVYRMSLPASSDTGSLGSLFMGAKLKFPLGLVVRGGVPVAEACPPPPCSSSTSATSSPSA